MVDFTTLIVIMGGVLSCFAWISKQLSDIRRDIASLDKNMVTHELCRTHRTNCPCVKDCSNLMDRILKIEQKIFVK